MRKLFYLTLVTILVFVAHAAATKKGYFEGKALSFSNLTREVYKPPKKISVRLIITSAPGKSISFDTKADEGDSVFNLIRTVTHNENLEFNFKADNGYMKVNSINNLSTSEGGEWIYFVNDQQKNLNPDSVILSLDDTIEWRYNFN